MVGRGLSAAATLQALRVGVCRCCDNSKCAAARRTFTIALQSILLLAPLHIPAFSAQSRLGAVQREKAALELDASLLSDRLAMNEDNLEAARQEAEDKASAALAEADNVRKELATAQAEAEALKRELAAMDGRLRDAVAAAAAAGSSVTGRLVGSRGRSVGTSPAPRGPSAGNAQGHPPSKEVGGLSDSGTASRGASSGGAAADTSTPAPTVAVVCPGSASASTEAEAAPLCSAAVANDVPGDGEAAQLREVRALLAATEQELQATQAKLRALSELAQAECVAVLANTGADASGEAGCQGGAADRQGVQALLATLRCCDVLHTKRSHGSNLASIRMMQVCTSCTVSPACVKSTSRMPSQGELISNVAEVVLRGCWRVSGPGFSFHALGLLPALPVLAGTAGGCAAGGAAGRRLISTACHPSRDRRPAAAAA